MLLKNKKPNLFVKANTEFNNSIYPIEEFKKELGKDNCYITQLSSSSNFLTKHKEEVFGYEVFYQKPDQKIVQDPINMDFDNGTFVCYDLETTGLQAKFDHITEIGAIKVTMKDGKEVKREEFQRFIKQDKPLKPFISKLTHITDEMLDTQGIPESQALEEFKQFCGDYPCIGHNILNFDNRFIAQKCIEHNLYQTIDAYKVPIYDNCQIDTVEISHLLNDRPNHTLRSMAQDLKITYDPKYQHRAIADVIVNWEVFKQTCIPTFKKLGVNNVKDINSLIKNSVIFNKQHRAGSMIVYPNQKGTEQLIKLAQTNSLTLSNIFKNNNNFICTNNPTSTEIISSYINDDKDDFEDTINKYDFITLPPPSFWTNLTSAVYATKTLDLTDENDKLLYNNRKELSKLLIDCGSDEERMKALGSSPIFSKLTPTLSNVDQLLSKISYVTNPLCSINKSGNDVTIEFKNDPALTKAQLEECYKKIINICKANDKEVIIDNEIMVPTQKQEEAFLEYAGQLTNNPWKRFIKTEDGCKVWKFNEREVKKELSFLDDKTVEDICTINPNNAFKQIKDFALEKPKQR